MAVCTRIYVYTKYIEQDPAVRTTRAPPGLTLVPFSCIMGEKGYCCGVAAHTSYKMYFVSYAYVLYGEFTAVHSTARSRSNESYNSMKSYENQDAEDANQLFFR